MRIWWALIFCIVSATAQARVVDGWGVTVPPVEWQSGPFLLPPVLHYLSEANLQDKCGSVLAIPSDWAFDGCVIPSAFNCHIWVRWDMPPPYTASVILHEEAHCRGWGADHPD